MMNATRMKALRFERKLKYVEDTPVPQPRENEALVRVLMAGICNTDIEITKGYMEFKGILGHFFASDRALVLGDGKLGQLTDQCRLPL